MRTVFLMLAFVLIAGSGLSLSAARQGAQLLKKSIERHSAVAGKV
jgi:hypothetical protein